MAKSNIELVLVVCICQPVVKNGLYYLLAKNIAHMAALNVNELVNLWFVYRSKDLTFCVPCCE
jgi:hypothetical protein